MAESSGPVVQPPIWRLKVDVGRPGCIICVNGQARGDLPAELELRGRANENIRLEVRDSKGAILASHDLRLHPFMPRTWSPEISGDVLPFRREA